MFNIFSKDEFESVDVNEINKIGLKNVIDIREKQEYELKNIKGVKNIPMIGLAMNPTMFLTKNKTYYIMCASGNRSHRLCKTLAKQGYKVVNLEGGINGYRG